MADPLDHAWDHLIDNGVETDGEPEMEEGDEVPEEIDPLYPELSVRQLFIPVTEEQDDDL